MCRSWRCPQPSAKRHGVADHLPEGQDQSGASRNGLAAIPGRHVLSDNDDENQPMDLEAVDQAPPQTQERLGGKERFPAAPAPLVKEQGRDVEQHHTGLDGARAAL